MATIKRKAPRPDGQRIKLRPPSFGTVLFTLVFIYILVRVIAYVNDSEAVVYTVEQSTYDTDFTTTGLAVRKETVINASQTGTPCYYIRDGEKVAKGAGIFSIDSSGKVQAAMDDMETNGESLLSSEDYTNISNQIRMFKAGFSNSGFGDVYSFKTNMSGKLMELYEELALDAAGGSGGGIALETQTAPFSGLVTYYEDGYESVDVNNITADLFDKSSYSKTSLKTNSGVSAGSPVCKLVDDTDWQIVINLSEEEYDKVTQNTYATFTINDSSRRIQVIYDTLEKDGHYYIVVSFNKYMAQYVNERFLDINFMFDESGGLKIPVSSRVTKDAYMIPVDYLSGGSGDTALTHLNVQATDESGKETVKQISPTIYFKDDRFCYVNPADLDSDAILVKTTQKGTVDTAGETFSVATAARYTMEGVLCISRGTAEFRRIEVTVEGDDYLIIKSGTTYGISRYDRILLDGSSAEEGDMIF